MLQANSCPKKIAKKLPNTPQKKQRKQQGDTTPGGRSVGEFSTAFSYAFSENWRVFQVPYALVPACGVLARLSVA